MIEVLVNNKKRMFPENWNEVQQNKRDFVHILSLFFRNQSRFTICYLAAVYYMKLSKLMTVRVMNYILKYEDDPEIHYLTNQLYRVAQLMFFIVDTQPTFNVNIYPAVLRFPRLFGTVSILQDCTVWEYAVAEDAVIQFHETDNELYLNRLIAVLYRPHKPFLFIRKRLNSFDGDTRIAFNDTQIEARARRVSRLPLPVRWYIYRWFVAQRTEIVKLHPHIYKSSGSDSNTGTWADTIISMSTVGQEEKTANTKLSVILRRLENEAKQLEELKRKQKTVNL